IEAPEFLRRFFTSARSRRDAAALSRAAWRCSGVSGGRAKAHPLSNEHGVVSTVSDGGGRQGANLVSKVAERQRGPVPLVHVHIASGVWQTSSTSCWSDVSAPWVSDAASCAAARRIACRSSTLRPGGGCFASYDAGSTPAPVSAF